MDRLVDPMDTLEDAITEDTINIKNVIERYRQYLAKNKDRLFKDAPRRKDLRIFEAVFHFNLYMYLYELIENRGGRVYPEFPTGNGKIDIIIKYNNRIFGVELKTYSDAGRYKKALIKAAEYGKQLGLKEISLVFFIEAIDQENKKKYEAQYLDETSGVNVIPIFVETGS
jgi:Holliday junction resolvase-like predicted endonuclease